jgi:HD-GYP domain-containing protein (c-di-GMP phosphodiesterase class II)
MSPAQDGNSTETVEKKQQWELPRLQNWTYWEDEDTLEPLQKLHAQMVMFYDLVKSSELSRSEFDMIFQNILLIFQESKPWGMFRNYLEGKLEQNDLAAKTTGFIVSANILGKALNWSSEEQFQLLKAAILHDAGMMRLSEEILQKKGRLDEEERKAIEHHPEDSRLIAIDLGAEGAVCRAVFEHHERFDGKGYPQGLRKDEISSYAQTLIVMDYFIAMVSNRAYRSAMVGFFAIKQLITQENKIVASQHLHNFVRAFGFHPPGSIVLLNNGAIVRVLESNPNNPLRPLVRVLVDQEGEVYQMQRFPHIKLIDQEDLYIVRSLGHEDLAEDESAADFLDNQ